MFFVKNVGKKFFIITEGNYISVPLQYSIGCIRTEITARLCSNKFHKQIGEIVYADKSPAYKYTAIVPSCIEINSLRTPFTSAKTKLLYFYEKASDRIRCAAPTLAKAYLSTSSTVATDIRTQALYYAPTVSKNCLLKGNTNSFSNNFKYKSEAVQQHAYQPFITKIIISSSPELLTAYQTTQILAYSAPNLSKVASYTNPILVLYSLPLQNLQVLFLMRTSPNYQQMVEQQQLVTCAMPILLYIKKKFHLKPLH